MPEFTLHRNQTINLLAKSIDWFLYMMTSLVINELIIDVWLGSKYSSGEKLCLELLQRFVRHF